MGHPNTLAASGGDGKTAEDKRPLLVLFQVVEPEQAGWLVALAPPPTFIPASAL